jgi:hypothetical protein
MSKACISAGDATRSFTGLTPSLTLIVDGQHSNGIHLERYDSYLTATV